jgi:GT2 family glycosyltransferase
MFMNELHSNRAYQLSIIILNYRSGEWLRLCLKSFTRCAEWGDIQAGKTIEVIVVDNHSEDDSMTMVKTHFPWVKWVGRSVNDGFAAGNNVGIQAAHAPFVMLLNSDTELTADTKLLDLLRLFTDQQVAVVTPKLLLDSGELDHASHRGLPTPWNALMYFSGVAKKLPKWTVVNGYQLSNRDLNSVHAVDACSGAAMVVRRTAIEAVGMLDEAYFMYGEDIDWCYRFKQAGWQIMFDPRVVITHHKHKSGLAKQVSWSTREKATTAFYDTMKQFYRKFYVNHYPALITLGFFLVIDTMKQRKLSKERHSYEAQTNSV